MCSFNVYRFQRSGAKMQSVKSSIANHFRLLDYQMVKCLSVCLCTSFLTLFHLLNFVSFVLIGHKKKGLAIHNENKEEGPSEFYSRPRMKGFLRARLNQNYVTDHQWTLFKPYPLCDLFFHFNFHYVSNLQILCFKNWNDLKVKINTATLKTKRTSK